jgi:hypothetical protein
MHLQESPHPIIQDERVLIEAFGTDKPKYPCKHCKRHRGDEGFRRLYHLNRHILNYHNIEVNKEPIEQKAKSTRLKYSFPVCPHLDCPQYRQRSFKELPHGIQAQQKPFESQSAYTKHMREVHNECTFPCDVAGCERVGRWGYFREKDLLKHRRDKRPKASAYEPPQYKNGDATQITIQKLLQFSHTATANFSEKSYLINTVA